MEFTKSIKSIPLMEDPNNLHLCFKLDQKTYALNAKNVLEVTCMPIINGPQKLPEYIVGILNYNDLFINVVDIRKVFSLPHKKYELTNKVIIMKGDESLIAMIVDEVTEFFTATPAQLQRVMGESFNNIIRTFYKIDENVVNIIDIAKLEETIKKVHFEPNTTNYSELFPQDETSIRIMNKRSTNIAAIPTMSLDAGFYSKDQYIIFTISAHTYCIYSLLVKELVTVKNYPVTKIPYTPEFIEGIINLKGSFYTVINLRKFIGFDNETDKKTVKDSKIMIIDSSKLKIAFIVDDIINIINIAQEHIEHKNDMKLDNLYIKAEAYIDDKVYNILNLEKLINDEKLYVDNSN